jgi:hypothetical protein
MTERFADFMLREPAAVAAIALQPSSLLPKDGGDVPASPHAFVAEISLASVGMHCANESPNYGGDR